ncbi:putative Zn-dependent peptidase [Isoptericola jiangsuensis]|uniref:Putative Zn-dependent peptidase n=1 Tax=Isoptericola jiangsuensis TaxID=548579 RepID=A0A2A9EVX0_9MICO|nr:insulinase family protein [Isoptericola jiangsuensis]PFG43287.1 putative Zn-dependent peptidase [Isoptericola jiangsuensis]
MSVDGSTTGTLRDGVTMVEVAGLPVLLAPTDGAVTGGLLFRVGQADEPLARSGITHLVEHLALHGVPRAGVHQNGQTGDVWTAFHATGSLQEVVTFLDAVCDRLRDLPVGRIDVERKVLEAEAASRGDRMLDASRIYRYGARGHGIAGYRELGLTEVGPQDVRAWVAERFTRGNAVAFLTADAVPAGLRLDLPAGERYPVPDTDTVGTYPAYFSTGTDGVVLDAVVDRSVEARFVARLAGRALFTELREEGVAYVADADYTPRDATTAAVTVYADARDDDQGAAVGAVVDLLARLRFTGPTPQELSETRTALLAESEQRQDPAAELPAHALAVLLGTEVPDDDETRARIEAVDAAVVRRVADAIWSTALLRGTPRGAAWAGMGPAADRSERAVVGTTWSEPEPDRARLVLGVEGVSLLTDDGPRTVLFDELAVMLAWPDGRRHLIGTDGTRVMVDRPRYTGLTTEVVAREIDARVPGRVVVRRTSAPAPAPTPPPRARRAWSFLWRALVAVVRAFGMLVGLLMLFGMLTALLPDGWEVAAVGLTVGVGSVWFARVFGRRRRTRRR